MSVIIAICAFAFVMSASPGPVNILTLGSGLNHGFGKTLPFVSGATIGFTLLLFLLSSGLGQVMTDYPVFLRIAGYAGLAWLAWLSFSLWRSAGSLSIDDKAARPGFMQGAFLQWSNPKAWIACLSGAAAFTPNGEMGAVLLFCGLYFVCCYIGVGAWAVFGSQARRYLSDTRILKAVNRGMAAILFGVTVYMGVTMQSIA